jgi:hypothetical protein
MIYVLISGMAFFFTLFLSAAAYFNKDKTTAVPVKA